MDDKKLTWMFEKSIVDFLMAAEEELNKRGFTLFLPEPQTEQNAERLPPKDVRERRERVKELWYEGYTDLQIAQALPTSEATVYCDRQAMGLKKKVTKT